MSSNSDYLDGIPTTPNTVSDSWQPAVEQIDTTKKGFNAISLGNWDTGTTKPTVLAGGEIESAGGVVRVATDETILDDPAGIASGTLYLVVDFSGTDPEWYFTNDVPVWNASLNGFYEAASGSVDWRYTGHRCEWDGAAAYSEKQFFRSKDGEDGILATGPDGAYADSGVSTDNVFVRYKKFSGTLDGNGDASFSHGLTSSTILGCTFSIDGDISTIAGPFMFIDVGSTFPASTYIRYTSTQIIIAFPSSFSNETYRLLVSYEA